MGYKFIAPVAPARPPLPSITTGSYGFSGSVSGLSIQDNDIGINLDDATMCSIVPTDAGMNSNMTGHLTITVGEVEIVASVRSQTGPQCLSPNLPPAPMNHRLGLFLSGAVRGLQLQPVLGIAGI